MKPSEFLKVKVLELHTLFPELSITYGIRFAIDTHIIKIVPADEFHNNKLLDDAWIPISIEFMQNNLDEGVTFVTSDSTLEIDEVVVQYSASKYIFQHFSDVLNVEYKYVIQSSFNTSISQCENKEFKGITLINSLHNAISNPSAISNKNTLNNHLLSLNQEGISFVHNQTILPKAA